MFVVVVDANVLYPFTLRDTLLRAAADEFYQVRWSAPILDEMERNLVSDGATTAQRAAKLRATMEKFFPDAEVRDFEPLVGAMMPCAAHLLDESHVDAPGTTYFYRLMVTTKEGQTITLGNLSVQAGVPVKEFELTSVGPNPSHGGRVSVQYAVAREAHIGISVVDIQGRTVAELANGTFRPGRYQAVWSGQLGTGSQAPAGMYFVRYQFPGKNVTKRIVIAQ